MSYYEITTRNTRQTLITYTLELLTLKLTNLYYIQSQKPVLPQPDHCHLNNRRHVQLNLPIIFHILVQHNHQRPNNLEIRTNLHGPQWYPHSAHTSGTR